MVVKNAMQVKWAGRQLQAVWQPEATDDGEPDVYQLSGADESMVPGTFANLRPPFVDSSPLLEALDAHLLALPDRVHWLTALRSVPERMQALRAEPKTIEPDGVSVAAAIACAKNPSSTVSILDTGEGMAKLIELDDQGRLLQDHWPEEVFNEDIDQARRLLIAQRTRSRA